jgi:SSS family solute:Na+ symporter
MNTLQTADYIVFFVYFIIISAYGYYVYQKKRIKGATTSTEFFLAEGSLTWWAIGASLIASNISAEHCIHYSRVSEEPHFYDAAVPVEKI